ncbi:MAG: hypothetical protein J6T01_00465 [Kiritimatiellae bacterium]|nr:hypothetical protein [Kiritimatiellia bacterium]
MVEVNEDPAAVTMKIQRETEAAKRRAAEDRANAAFDALQTAAPRGELRTVAHRAGPVRQIPGSTRSPESYFRTASFAVAAVLVIVFVWACLRVARSRGSGN